MCMKRHRTNRIKRFIITNRRLLLFLLLPLSGCVCGVLLHTTLQNTVWASMLTLDRISVTFGGVVAAWWECYFPSLLLLTVLFLCGLSVCGAPAAMMVPMFWGLGLGLIQARYYADGWRGIAVVAAVVLPRAVMEAVALLMGASECLQMSLRFAGQLLPRSATCGGLWQSFRLYLLRFLALSALLAGAAAMDVILRIVCSAML